LVSPGKLAVIVSVPGLVPGVYVREQVAVAPVPLRLQYPANVPLPLVVIVTSPVGVMGALDEVSVTVTVQIVPEPLPTTTDEGVQLTLVMVVLFGRVVTVKLKDWLPLLVLGLWVPSPL
jgi:hypothetical protein